jgi:flagellar hook protein FlgE
MSLFGAMNSAISGLTAQSDAFGEISDNVANSQTVGYKRVDTSFVDFLTTSTATRNDPGAVVARPDYVNGVQGTVKGTDSPLNVAIAGQGFFAVSQQTGVLGGKPAFNPQQFYSRAGDFSLNSQGYLVNTAGQYLNGWVADPVTKIVSQNALIPLQITQTALNPVATSNVSLSANLPASPVAGTAAPATATTAATPISSDITIYDALGTAHTVTLGWTQTTVGTSSDWTVTVTSPDALDTTGTAPAGTKAPFMGTAEVVFGGLTSGGDQAAAGTISSIGNYTAGTSGQELNPIPPIAPAGYLKGDPANMKITMDFGSGPQDVTLDLGTLGGSSGVTQYAGTTYNLEGLSQDGVPPGSYSGVTIQANGNVVVNYNNGQTKTIGEVPLVTFNAPDALQRQNGQSFTATIASGSPLAEAVNTNGAGSLVVSSVESSNVDIATEFSKLIVAQQAYAANTKVVTTANDMLQATISMKQ